MPADPARLRFFVDESALGLGKVLAIARYDVIHAGHPLIPEVPVGTLDPDWIPAVARRRLVVIARDRRIRTKPGELRLLRDHGLRMFWIGGRRDLTMGLSRPHRSPLGGHRVGDGRAQRGAVVLCGE